MTEEKISTFIELFNEIVKEINKSSFIRDELFKVSQNSPNNYQRLLASQYLDIIYFLNSKVPASKECLSIANTFLNKLLRGISLEE